MSAFIKDLRLEDKAGQLCRVHGAVLLRGPPAAVSEVPEDKTLICVAHKAGQPGDVAACVADAGELAAWRDGRKEFEASRAWLLMDKALAEKLSVCF